MSNLPNDFYSNGDAKPFLSNGSKNPNRYNYYYLNPQEIEYIPAPATSDQKATGIMLAAMAFCAAVFWALSSFAAIVENRADYALPYKLAAWFYDYTIIVPLKSVVSVWYWLLLSDLTPWVTLNVCIAVIGAAAWCILVIMLFLIVIEYVANMFESYNNGRPYHGVAWFIYLLPAIFALSWYLLSSGYNLIF